MLIVLDNSLPQSFRDHFNQRAKDPSSDIRLLSVQNDNFANSETRPDLFPDETPEQFDVNSKELKGQPVTIILSLTENVNETAFKLLAMIRNLKRYGSGPITVAMPFAPFGRQDRPFANKHCSIMGDDFPFLLKAAGADRVITAEVHSKATENFYINHFGEENVSFLSFTDLYAQDLLAATEGTPKDNLVVGAPDGADKPEDAGIRRARQLGGAVWKSGGDAQYFNIRKQRNGRDTKLLGFEGDVQDRITVTVDDMSESGGTCINAAKVQKDNGARQTRVYLAHGLFNEKALHRLLTERAANDSVAIDEMIVADTVPGLSEKFAAVSGVYPGRLATLNVAPLFEKEIMRPQIRPASLCKSN